MVLKIMVLPRSFFIPMYYETDVILCSAWSSFLELGQAHYKNKIFLFILLSRLWYYLDPFLYAYIMRLMLYCVLLGAHF